MIKIVTGDLIKLATEGNFQVIGHGCNCFCRMKRGIAPQMHRAFGCGDPLTMPFEAENTRGQVDKLGQIQCMRTRKYGNELIIVNMYTQFHWKEPDPISGIPLNYAALRLCLQKMGRNFAGKTVGLPWIGCGLAGGNKAIVKSLIEKTMYDCDVFIVEQVEK